MAFVKVCPLEKFPPGSLMEFSAGDILIAICNRGGEIRAIGGVCPHQGGPLGEGAMNGEYVVCPWHAWEFNCTTGENDFDPETRVPVYPVRVDGGDILVDPGA